MEAHQGHSFAAQENMC